MHKLTDMSMTDAERDGMYPAAPMEAKADGPSYPWGLRLTLDEDALKKLDIGRGVPDVGTLVTVRARARVIQAREEQRTSGGETKRVRSVDIQIERMAVDKELDSMEEALDDGISEA